MSDALCHMIDALASEMAAIQKKGGGTQVDLRGGELAGQAEGSWLYRFVVADDLNLRDETPVRVTCGQDDVPGVLVSFRDGVLVVAIEKDLGPKIATARLVTNNSFLLDRLKKRLETVRSGKVEFSRHAADRVLGLTRGRSADAEPDSIVLQGSGRPNDDQIAAVRRSLGSDTTYIWGPPGTGKTTTLARIVEAHYRAGSSVLLVSNTNIAVDTALERVAERLMGESDFHQGLVLRQGPVVKEELRQRFGAQVILQEIVARMGESLRHEREEFSRQAVRLETEERALITALKQLDQLEHAQDNTAALEASLATARANTRKRAEESEQHRARAASLRADLDRARSMGAIRRFLSGLQPARLERDMIAASRAAQATEDAARAIAGEIARQEDRLKDLHRQIDRLTRATRDHPTKPGLRTQCGAVRTHLSQVRQRISVIDRELAALEQEVLARCRILATTVYRTYLSKAAPRQFDVVVIDEASMLMPPLVYYAAGLAKQAVTIAGDFRQLPPIVSSDAPIVEEWLKRDVFDKAGIPERLQRRQPTPHLVALRTQYRMREPICELVNRFFYSDHPLRSDPSVGLGGGCFPLGSSPLLYVDTAPFHPWAARDRNKSRYNLLHALLVRNIVLRLAEVGFLPPLGVPNDAVGAVTRYAAQARLIQALLDDRLGAHAAGVAATVHRFQGNEKALMVLDFTDSFGPPGQYLQAVRVEEEGARLLNVAISRARHHVVLVGNFKYLRAQLAGAAIVRQLIDHFEERGDALDLNKLPPFAESDWVDGLHQVLPRTFELPDGAAGAFTEGTFYPEFLRDLACARASILIVSLSLSPRIGPDGR